jgi:hypothetical protein
VLGCIFPNIFVDLDEVFVYVWDKGLEDANSYFFNDPDSLKFEWVSCPEMVLHAVSCGEVLNTWNVLNEQALVPWLHQVNLVGPAMR